MPERSARSLWVLSLLVAAAGIGLRFAALDRKPLSTGEAEVVLWLSGHDARDLEKELVVNRPIPSARLERYVRLDAEAGSDELVARLAASAPRRGPLLPVLAKGWAGIFGDRARSLRALPALVGLLQLPAVAWLAWELFASRSAVLWAAALLAVSPIHVLYARDLGPYGLLTLVSLLSLASLLRAWRRRTVAAWGLYAVSVTAGLWTHPLYLVVAAAGAAAVGGATRFRTTAPVYEWGLSTTAGTLPALPWLANAVLRLPVRIDWARAARADWIARLREYALDASAVVFDPRAWNDEMLRLASVPVLVLIGAALWSVLRRTRRPAALALLVLIGSLPLTLAAGDVVAGARPAGWAWGTPGYIGVSLAIAHLLATTPSAGAGAAARLFWSAVKAAVLAGGLLCSVLAVTSARGWDGADHWREIARHLSASERHPLIVSDRPLVLLAFSHVMPDGIDVLAPPPGQPPWVSVENEEVFVIDSSEGFRRLLAEGGWKLVRVDDRWPLWHLRPARPTERGGGGGENRSRTKREHG